MSRFPETLLPGLAACLLMSTAGAQTVPYADIGRAATTAEIAAWDIDVRPDFRGLPKGSGTVDQGMEVWESKCASCHGVFGESNQFFSPMVGGTTKEDIESGKVARLMDNAYPARTTLMKLSQLSTLWDYIHRAMPWNAPKSLSTDDVYGVTAYLLNLGNIVPADFKLSDQNIAEVQKKLPNRFGMTTDHALWPGAPLPPAAAAAQPASQAPPVQTPKPDVQATACMKDCIAADAIKVTSSLPEFARDAHGNLAEQNRLVGAQVGANTHQPPAESLAAQVTLRAAAGITTKTPAAAAAGDKAARPASGAAQQSDARAVMALLQANACTACHAVDNKVIGPSYADVSKKYRDQADAVGYLAAKIKSGGVGVWGSIPMPAQGLPPADAKAIAEWLVPGAAKP
ncbi:MAG: c-type cytochrome [Burkholderiaceae bacterium]